MYLSSVFDLGGLLDYEDSYGKLLSFYFSLVGAFGEGYSEWNLHGEGSTTSSPSRLNNEQEEIFDHDMQGLLNDIFHPTPPQQSIGSGLIGEGEVQMSESNVNTRSGETNGRKKFQSYFLVAEEKMFDQRFPEFASDPRNVRLALASDGFNPFRTMNVAHSICQTNFMLRVLASIHVSNFPGYGNLYWLEAKGKLAFFFMWSFVGCEEMRVAPIPSTGAEVLRQLESVDFLIDNAQGDRWKKKSIFFKLPYWEHMLLRHNLDVMHIEKNVCDNIIGTLLGHKGKSKDNYNARLDLKEMGIRKELHPKQETAKEVRLGGPEAFRWMYPIERDLLTLKSYVHNRAHLEGSITQGYIVKGYRFHTKEREKGRKTQNSGIVVSVKGESYASSRDRRPVEGVINYYGKLNDIIELNYSGKIRVVLFRVDKVFYCEDQGNKGLVSVETLFKVKDVFYMGSVTGQDVDQGQSDGTFNASHLHRICDDGDDGEDVTSDMEHDGTDDEEDDVE
ncbi:uncharacterized protein Tco_0877292 [Tanacetum coccineum]|uniref:DUF4218 domain-containing protein n=1 Tax=Tanacetum coccineum TaxID=301880 RepID=A0ABQ5BXD3_9ASTR